MAQSETEVDSKAAWWRFGYVWMVIAGPAVVVVASFVTFYMAAKGMDQVDEDYYRKGEEISRTLADNPNSLAPAVKARNHAQTGVQQDPQKP